MHLNLTLLYISFFMCSICCDLNAQDLNLADYLWKNRIVVLAYEEDSPVIQKQLDILLTDTEGLIDRKLLIIQVEPNRYKQIALDKEGSKDWIKSDKLFKRLKSQSNSFEIQLIGLDGGLKMKSDAIVTPAALFALIDGMPMRQIELRNRKQ